MRSSILDLLLLFNARLFTCNAPVRNKTNNCRIMPQRSFAVKRVDPANRALRRLINALDAPPAAGSSRNVSADSLAAAAPVVDADVGASVEPAQHDSRSSAVPCTHANGCCKRHPKSCAAGRRTPPKGAEHRKGVEHRIK